MKFDEDTIRHPKRGVRKMFPTVAETLGEVWLRKGTVLKTIRVKTP